MKEERKATILLVDDDPHLMRMLSDYLEYEEFTVAKAQSGEEAMERLATAQPDVILLDICMAGMGGLGFLKRIAGEDGKPRFPVIVLTARAAMEEFFGTMDVAGFLAKPCPAETVVQTVRDVLAKARRSEEEKGPRWTILLGEDNPAVRTELARKLSANGHRVVEAANGEEFLEKAVALMPDLVVVKELLPRLTGTELVQAIRSMPALNGVRIMLYDTTHAHEDDRTVIYRHQEGCDRHLLTSDVPVLVRAAEELLKKPRQP